MGRRKGKKGNPGKRSLVFEESPVTDSGLCAWSPVLCADNPVTAVPIPVDSDCSVAWVSPQFEGIAVSGGRRRQARRGPHKTSVLGDRTARDNSSTSSRISSRRKFPALQFVGDSGSSGKKPVLKAKGRGEKTTRRLKNGQDSQLMGKRAVAVSEGGTKNGNEGEDDAENVCGADPDVTCDGDSDGDSDDGDGEGDYGCAEAVRRRASCRHSTGLRHRPSLARASLYRPRRSELPVNEDSPSSCTDEANKSTRRPCGAQQQKLNVRNHGDSDNLCENSDVKAGDGGKRFYNSDILLSPADVSSMSESRRGTLVAVGALPLRAALFASPSEDASNSFMRVDHTPPQHLLNHSRTSSASPGARLLTTRTGAGEEERLSSRMKPATSRQKEKPRRSERLKHQREEAMKRLRQRTPQKRRSGKILVTDTPECEYSLTFKQRLRMRWKQTKMFVSRSGK